ncbi:MAG: polysaccharide deacetylase family protein [Sediminispirochaetaceae bacterium]
MVLAAVLLAGLFPWAGGRISLDVLGAQETAGTQFRLGLLAPLSSAEGEGREEAAAIAGFALRRIPEIQGIPYTVIDAPDELLEYPLVIAAEAPSNRDLDPEWREALYRYVEEGGILFLPGRSGSELFPLLGVRSISSNKIRSRVEFTGRDPAFAYIDHPNERRISIGNGEKEVYREFIWSHGAEADTMGEVLARFDDGSAAMVRSYYGRGIAYYFGLSFAESVLLPQTGGDYEAQRRFVNTFEPSADVIMLLVKSLYEEFVPRAVYVSPIPEARPTALLLSHDVDAQTSFLDSLKFAALAEEFGAHSTFFINTKYYKNWMDIAYYTVPEKLQAVRRISQRGHELGSHTVAHALEFDEAPPGSPRVSFDTYRPQERITINGEVRVSKELLDRDVRGQNTVSFRAGYLAFPPELISILEAAGYKYDSSFSANDVLTTFPYFALPQRQPGEIESSIVEIPVTFDEAVGYLTSGNRAVAVKQWKEVVTAHAANETISVLLVHPSDTRDRTYKLDAQRELMEHARGLDAWMGGIGEFGDFWRARHELRITDVRLRGRSLEIQLSQAAEEIHRWAGLVLPGAERYEEVRVMDASGAEITYRERTESGKLFLDLQR